MHTHELFPTESRTANRARIRARLRRNKALGAAISVLIAVGVLFGTTGSASALPSAGDWLKLRTCESGGDYSINTGNGYYGAYQFDLGTWQSVGGSGLPSNASPATQDALAYKLWQERGWSPWTCAAIVGLPEGGSGGPAPVAAVAVVHPPSGHFDGLTASGNRIWIAGWAFDPSSSGSAISVRITINSATLTASAGASRPDVNRVMRVAGGHGFSVPVDEPAGTYRVCVTALGRAAGNNTSLGCKSLTIRALPGGSLDVAGVSNNSLVIRGWALDPNVSSRSIGVHIYVNNAEYALTASGARRDVNAVMQVGGNHGFNATLPLRPGVSSVCAYAMGVYGHTLIGCRSVRLPAPVGYLDAVSVQGSSAIVSGWAFEPSAANKSIPVHIYVNGAEYGGSTSTPRADVDLRLGIGGVHGYRVSVPLRAASNRVCAYAIGTVSGNNTLLGCKTVGR